MGSSEFRLFGRGPSAGNKMPQGRDAAIGTMTDELESEDLVAVTIIVANGHCGSFKPDAQPLQHFHTQLGFLLGERFMISLPWHSPGATGTGLPRIKIEDEEQSYGINTAVINGRF